MSAERNRHCNPPSLVSIFARDPRGIRALLPVDNQVQYGLDAEPRLPVAYRLSNRPSGRTTVTDKNATTLEGRLSRLEIKANLLIALAVILIGAAGGAYWKLWDIGKDIGSLTGRVDGYENVALMKLFSDVRTGEDTPAARELNQAVEKIMNDTKAKNQRGEPVPPGLHYELGIFSANNGELEQAIGYFQRATQGNPLDYRAFSSMGACYLWLAEMNPERTTYYATKALNSLNKAIEINPNHAKAHNNLGIAYYLTDQLTLATEEWNAAIKIDHEFDAPYYNFACMYAGETQTQKALQFLEEAVDKHGYANLTEIEGDEARCFKSLRSHPKFRQLKRIIAKRTRSRVVP